MRIRELHWLDHIVDKIERKHRVSPDEVEEMFRSELHVRAGAAGTYRAYGRTLVGRYLFAVFVMEESATARIITAREMTNSERKLYHQSR